MARSESLSSTSRIGGSAGDTGRGLIPSPGGAGSPQPAGRNASAPRFFEQVLDGFLVVRNRLLEAIELGDRLASIPLDHVLLRRVVAVHEIGGQRVDAAVQGIGVRLIALELLLHCF